MVPDGVVTRAGRDGGACAASIHRALRARHSARTGCGGAPTGGTCWRLRCAVRRRRRGRRCRAASRRGRGTGATIAFARGSAAWRGARPRWASRGSRRSAAATGSHGRGAAARAAAAPGARRAARAWFPPVPGPGGRAGDRSTAGRSCAARCSWRRCRHRARLRRPDCGGRRAGADAEATQRLRIEGVELPAALLQRQRRRLVGAELEAEQVEQGVDAALLGTAHAVLQLGGERFRVGLGGSALARAPAASISNSAITRQAASISASRSRRRAAASRAKFFRRVSSSVPSLSNTRCSASWS
jgi:hypothetical protein